MRTLAIELFHEDVELSLLLQDIGAGRAGGFLLERQMHAFMAAVLLGMTRLDALDRDAQPQPPD